MSRVRFVVLVSLVPVSAQAVSPQDLVCPANPDPDCTDKCSCSASMLMGDPVTVNGLNTFLIDEDIALKSSVGPLTLSRRYLSADNTGQAVFGSAPTPFGLTPTDGTRWSHNYFSMVERVGADFNGSDVYVRVPTGGLKHFANCALDAGTTCWATPYSANSSEPRRLKRLSTGWELYEESGERYGYYSRWQKGSEVRWFLSWKDNARGQRLATLNYRQPAPGGESCDAGNTGDPGVPYIDTIESPDKSAIRFRYAVGTEADGDKKCIITNADVGWILGDGGSNFSSLVTYSYPLNAQSKPIPGYLSGVQAASFSETFNYVGGFFRHREGTEWARQLYSSTNVSSISGEGVNAAIWVPSCTPPNCDFCSGLGNDVPCCSASVRRVLDAGVARGDGTEAAASKTTTYFLAAAGAALHGKYAFRVSEGCQPETACSAGNEWHLWYQIDAGTICDTHTYYARERMTSDKRQNYTDTPHRRARPDAGGSTVDVWEKLSTSWGIGTDDAGVFTAPLARETYEYGYDSQSRQRLQKVTSASVMGGGDVETVIRYTAGTSLSNAIFRSGKTKTSGSITNRTLAIFYTRDGGGRVTAVEGPCFLTTYQDYNATSCASGAPYTTLEYWPSTDGTANAGRLKRVTRFPGGTGGMGGGLITEYGNYSPLGDPGTITDVNNSKTHTLGWVGRELRSFLPSGATSATDWELDWENGELIRVKHPEGNYEVFCHRAGGAGGGACDGAWTKQLQWHARSQNADGTSWSERAVFEYWPDETLKVERRFVNGEATPRLTRFHSRDGSKRPTWERSGVDAGGYLVKRHFDGADNQDAISHPFNEAAPDFCKDGADKSLLCSWLEHDRMNRPAMFDTYPAGAEPGIRTCFDYDTQSNVKRVATGCQAQRSNFDGCDLNNTVGGGSSCSVPSDYQSDDFGNVIEARLASMGDGGTSPAGAVQYEYNALGLPVLKQTNEGSTTYVYDALGRLTNIRPTGFGDTFQLTYDSASMSGCGLAPSNQASRLAKVVEVGGAWETMFGYDELGRLTNEYRRPAGAPGCPYRNTTYTYNANGNLSSVTYPHGRVVTYTYGTSLGLNNRVEKVEVNFWTGTAWSGTKTLVSSVKWEPFGGLRGYHINFSPTSTYATLEYELGDDSSTPPSGSGCELTAPSMTSYDGTGRLRSLRLTSSSSPTPIWQGDGDLFKKSYTWKGDLVSRIDTCYLSMTTSIRENLSYDNSLRLVQDDVPNFATTGGFQTRHAFTYDARGNRTMWQVDNGGAQVHYTFAGGTTPDRVLEEKPFSGTAVAHRYGVDRDGRVSSRSLLDYEGNVAPSTETFLHHIATGPDTSISEVSSSAGTYVYLYDVFGRRTYKSYPNYDADRFVYAAAGRELFEDVGVTSAGNTDSFPIDDYVWLGGRAIAQLRGRLDASEGRTTPADNSEAACDRLWDGARCDFYFLVTDHVGKPVLMLDSRRRISGVGEAEPFGRMNTVEWWNSIVPSTTAGTTTFSTASQPTLGMNVDMRPYFQTLDLELEACGWWPNLKYDAMHRYDNNSYHDSRFGSGQANVRMPWLPLTPHASGGTQVGTMRLRLEADNENCPRGAYQSSCFPTCSPSTPYSGVQLRRYDYRRYETVTRWGSGTNWKQTETVPASNWNQVGFTEDSSWQPAAEEDAHPAWPWGSTVVFPPSTTAEWIWSYESRWGSDTKTVYFRKTFTAASSRALITLTADNSFTAFLNGVQIATGNDWTQRVVTVVALVPGSQNVLAIVATNAGGPGGLLVDVNETATPMWTALRFPGQYYDAETDLHENGHRFYDPEIGRYLQPEPILRSPYAQVAYAYSGHSLPVYSYAGNNPLRFVDPDGFRFRVNNNVGATSGAAWASILRQASNPWSGSTIREMAADPSVIYDVTDAVRLERNGGGETEPMSKWHLKSAVWLPWANSAENRCRSTAPTSTFPQSYDALIAHEIGHAWSFANEWNAPRWINDQRSLDFENAVRRMEGSPMRGSHDDHCVNCSMLP